MGRIKFLLLIIILFLSSSQVIQNTVCNVWRILASKLIPRFGERLYYCDSSNDLDNVHLLWNHVKTEIHCRSRTYSEHLDNFHDYGTSVHAV